jgi:hypothetical protein
MFALVCDFVTKSNLNRISLPSIISVTGPVIDAQEFSGSSLINQQNQLTIKHSVQLLICVSELMEIIATLSG